MLINCDEIKIKVNLLCIRLRMCTAVDRMFFIKFRPYTEINPNRGLQISLEDWETYVVKIESLRSTWNNFG